MFDEWPAWYISQDATSLECLGRVSYERFRGVPLFRREHPVRAASGRWKRRAVLRDRSGYILRPHVRYPDIIKASVRGKRA